MIETRIELELKGMTFRAISTGRIRNADRVSGSSPMTFPAADTAP
jgi:hypothetical protein